jgi:hypothetical protein
MRRSIFNTVSLAQIQKLIYLETKGVKKYRPTIIRDRMVLMVLSNYRNKALN